MPVNRQWHWDTRLEHPYEKVYKQTCTPQTNHWRRLGKNTAKSTTPKANQLTEGDLLKVKALFWMAIILLRWRNYASWHFRNHKPRISGGLQKVWPTRGPVRTNNHCTEKFTVEFSWKIVLIWWHQLKETTFLFHIFKNNNKKNAIFFSKWEF